MPVAGVRQDVQVNEERAASSGDWSPNPSWHLLRAYIPSVAAFGLLVVFVAASNATRDDWITLGLVATGLFLFASVRLAFWARSFAQRKVRFTESAIEIQCRDITLSSTPVGNLRSVALWSGQRFPEWAMPGLFDRVVVDVPGYGETQLPQLLVLRPSDRRSLEAFLESQCHQRDLRFLGLDDRKPK